MRWMRCRVSSDALTNLDLKLLPVCSVFESSRTDSKSVNGVKWEHWFPRRTPPGQDKEQWMMMRAMTSKIAHKIPIHGGLHATKLDLMLTNKNIINARIDGIHVQRSMHTAVYNAMQIRSCAFPNCRRRSPSVGVVKDVRASWLLMCSGSNWRVVLKSPIRTI